MSLWENQFIFRLLYRKGVLKNKLKNHVIQKKLAFKLLTINLCSQAKGAQELFGCEKSVGVERRAWGVEIVVAWMVNDDKATTAESLHRRSGKCLDWKLTFYIDEGHEMRQDKLFVSVFFLYRQSDARLSNRIVCFLCNWYQFTREKRDDKASSFH